MNQAVAATPGNPPTAEGTPERADLAAWLAVLAGTIAAFMALLDSSIVNAALPVIQGEIGATTSEGTWVNTTYLVAEIVIMPLTVWFERMFGLRRVLLVGSVLFTVFSVVCGFATNLEMMIFGRIGQGLAGGVMIPTGMTIVAKRLPVSQQSIGMALFASAALLGPIVGPLLGGWITENASWHYAFFINVPICAALVILIVAAMPVEPSNLSEFGKADWLGVFGMMASLGALTVLLEEGHREQWFSSTLIWKLAAISVAGMAIVAIGQLRAPVPVLKLSLLRDRALSAVLFLMAVVGVVLFATLFAVPQFLAAIAGYNALQSGLVLTAAGIVSILAALVYPILVARLDLRIFVGSAMLLSGVASYLAGGLTTESTGAHFVWPLIMMGIGTAFTAIPLQQAALSAVEVDDSGEATSMFNVARNLGGSIGLAVMASAFDQRLAFHHWRINEAIGANDSAAWARLTDLTRLTGTGSEGMVGAVRLLDTEVMRQSLVMAYQDIFVGLALASFLSAPLVLLLRPIDPERAQGMAH